MMGGGLRRWLQFDLGTAVLLTIVAAMFCAANFMPENWAATTYAGPAATLYGFPYGFVAIDSDGGSFSLVAAISDLLLLLWLLTMIVAWRNWRQQVNAWYEQSGGVPPQTCCLFRAVCFLVPAAVAIGFTWVQFQVPPPNPSAPEVTHVGCIGLPFTWIAYIWPPWTVLSRADGVLLVNLTCAVALGSALSKFMLAWRRKHWYRARGLHVLPRPIYVLDRFDWGRVVMALVVLLFLKGLFGGGFPVPIYFTERVPDPPGGFVNGWRDVPRPWAFVLDLWCQTALIIAAARARHDAIEQSGSHDAEGGDEPARSGLCKRSQPWLSREIQS